MKLVSFILIGLFWTQLSYAREKTTIYPFGMRSPQPPSPGSATYREFSIGIRAKQVCGYTYWSTVGIELPKKLLSKDFWAGVGENLKKQAIDTAMALSAALPSMLVCNVSPTFCSIMNQAELLAQFEFNYTTDTCKTLEAIGDVLPKNEELADCMEKNTSSYPGVAREKCLAQSDSLFKKKTRVSGTQKTDNGYEKLLSALCPGDNSSTHSFYPSGSLSGHHKMTKHTKTCSFFKKLPWISVNAQARFIKKGTFSDVIEEELSEIHKEVENDVTRVVSIMQRPYKKGSPPRDVIDSAKSEWENINLDSESFPMYMRASSISRKPHFLIKPEQLFQLNRLVSEDGIDRDREDPGSAYMTALSQVSTAASFLHMLDKLSGLQSKLITVCSGSSEFQGGIEKENCEKLKTELQVQMQSLRARIEVEKHFLETQKNLNQFVDIEMNSAERIRTSKKKINREKSDLSDTGLPEL